VGLVTMARFLTWALTKHNNLTLSLLTGFMIGALNKLWPWSIPQIVMNKEDRILEFTKGIDYEKVITSSSVSPSVYAEKFGQPAFLLASILFFLLGIVLVLGLEKYSPNKNNS